MKMKTINCRDLAGRKGFFHRSHNRDMPLSFLVGRVSRFAISCFLSFVMLMI
jgi:hypothetical protein